MQITEKITFAISRLIRQSVLFLTIVLHNKIQEQSLIIFSLFSIRFVVVDRSDARENRKGRGEPSKET